MAPDQIPCRRCPGRSPQTVVLTGSSPSDFCAKRALMALHSTEATCTLMRRDDSLQVLMRLVSSSYAVFLFFEEEQNRPSNGGRFMRAGQVLRHLHAARDRLRKAVRRGGPLS